MKFKKISAILLAAAMLTAVGCGKKTEETEAPTDETTTVTESILESEGTDESTPVDESDAGMPTFVPDASEAVIETETETVATDYSQASWYGSNVPIDTIEFYNSTETTWDGQEIPCYFPGTDISLVVKPQTAADSLIFNVVYVDADMASVSGGIDLASIPEDNYVVRDQSVAANADGNYVLDWSDSHIEEWTGMAYVFITSTDGSVAITARTAIGVPTLIAQSTGT